MVPSTLEPPADGSSEPMRMLMVMEILHPVHWTVRAFVDPQDLRHMVWTVLKNPGLILRGIKFLFMKSPVYQTSDGPETQTAGVNVPKSEPIHVPAQAPRTGPGPIPAARPGPGPIPGRRVSR